MYIDIFSYNDLESNFEIIMCEKEKYIYDKSGISYSEDKYRQT